MQTNKNGFVYRVAYGHSENPPSTTNLCRLFWRFFISLFIIWPILLVVCGLAYAAGFFVGKRIGIYDGETAFWADIRHIPTFRGVRLLPIYLFLMGGGIWLAVKVIHGVVLLVSSFWDVQIHPFALHFVGGLVGAVVALWLLVFGLGRLFCSEPWLLFKAFLKAKKQKVCPIVHVN